MTIFLFAASWNYKNYWKYGSFINIDSYKECNGKMLLHSLHIYNMAAENILSMKYMETRQ